MTDLIQAFVDDGFVVLADVIPVSVLDVLCEKMLADVEAILARTDTPFNFNRGNIQQAPPPFAPYLFEEILFNPQVIALTRSILGQEPKNTFYSGNTALPGEHFQPVHPDVGQLWPHLAHATPTFGIVVNVPVVDMSAENGATQLWPGTHHDTTYSLQNGSTRIPEAQLASWRARRPPVQPTVPRGSVLLRDIRLWHAGMPNRTHQPRPMIAMIHWCGWMAEGEAIEIPERSQGFFANPALRTVTRTIPDTVFDHTRHGGAYDMQDPP